LVILWEDLNSSPSGWQQRPINAVSKFWVRAKVNASFSTPSVGTQLTAVPESKYVDAI
jgi:hypothetical protein